MEHRAANLVRYATWAQRLQTTASEAAPAQLSTPFFSCYETQRDNRQAFVQQLVTLRRTQYYQASARAASGVLQTYASILSCFEKKGDRVCGIRREEQAKASAVQAFVRVLAMVTCGKMYPSSTKHLLEVMFSGTWDGLPTEQLRHALASKQLQDA